ARWRWTTNRPPRPPIGAGPGSPAGSGVFAKSRFRWYSWRGIEAKCLPSAVVRGFLGFLVFAATSVAILVFLLVELALPAVVAGSPAAAEAAIRDRLRAAGVQVDAVSLARGRIDLTIAGQLVETQTTLTESSVSLDAGAAFTSVPILSAPPGGEWRIDEVD